MNWVNLNYCNGSGRMTPPYTNMAITPKVVLNPHPLYAHKHAHTHTCKFKTQQ